VIPLSGNAHAIEVVAKRAPITLCAFLPAEVADVVHMVSATFDTLRSVASLTLDLKDVVSVHPAAIEAHMFYVVPIDGSV